MGGLVKPNLSVNLHGGLVKPNASINLCGRLVKPNLSVNLHGEVGKTLPFSVSHLWNYQDEQIFKLLKLRSIPKNLNYRKYK